MKHGPSIVPCYRPLNPEMPRVHIVLSFADGYTYWLSARDLACWAATLVLLGGAYALW